MEGISYLLTQAGILTLLAALVFTLLGHWMGWMRWGHHAIETSKQANQMRSKLHDREVELGRERKKIGTLETEIEEYTTRLNRITSERDSLRLQTAKLESNQESLQEQLAEVDHLKTEWGDFEGRAAQFAENEAAIAKQNEELRKQREELEIAKADLARSQEQFDIERTLHSEESTRFLSEKNHWEVIQKGIATEREDLDAARQLLNKEKEEFTATRQELVELDNGALQRAEALKREKDELEAEWQRLNKEKEEFAASRQELVELDKGALERAEALKREKEDLEREKEYLKRETEELERKQRLITFDQEKTEETREEIRQDKLALAEKRRRFKEEQEEFEEEKVQYSLITRERDRLAAELERLKEDPILSAEGVSALQAERNDLSERLIKQGSDFSKISERLALAESRSKEMEEENAALRERCEKLNGEAHRLKENGSQSIDEEIRRAQLERSLEEMTRERDSLVARFVNLERAPEPDGWNYRPQPQPQPLPQQHGPVVERDLYHDHNGGNNGQTSPPRYSRPLDTDRDSLEQKVADLERTAMLAHQSQADQLAWAERERVALREKLNQLESQTALSHRVDDWAVRDHNSQNGIPERSQVGKPWEIEKNDEKEELRARVAALEEDRNEWALQMNQLFRQIRSGSNGTFG